MANRSNYNERLLFEDPSGSHSASRSTRYRLRKRARKQEYEQNEPPYECFSDAVDTELPSQESESLQNKYEHLALLPEDLSLESSSLIDYDDNPQVLEAEVGTDEDEVCEDINQDIPLSIGNPETLSTDNDLLYN